MARSAPRKPSNRKPKPSGPADKLRSWRVAILRSRAEYLGNVRAADARSAEAAAVAQFGLDEHQRKRLIVREQE